MEGADAASPQEATESTDASQEPDDVAGTLQPASLEALGAADDPQAPSDAADAPLRIEEVPHESPDASEGLQNAASTPQAVSPETPDAPQAPSDAAGAPLVVNEVQPESPDAGNAVQVIAGTADAPLAVGEAPPEPPDSAAVGDGPTGDAEPREAPPASSDGTNAEASGATPVNEVEVPLDDKTADGAGVDEQGRPIPRRKISERRIAPFHERRLMFLLNRISSEISNQSLHPFAGLTSQPRVL
jgi:hypothetical protein